MEVKILKETIADGKKVKKDKRVVLPENEAKLLIALGKAESMKEEEEEEEEEEEAKTDDKKK